MEKRIRSSRRNPCPVCGRTKDADCSWNDVNVLCHTYIDADPQVKNYTYKHPSKCGTWGVFVLEDKSIKYEAKAPRARARTEYIYTNERQFVVQVIRADRGDGTKTFSQSRWENGRWTPGLNDGVKPKIRLYQIENFLVQRAVQNGDRVLVVEGEGKVDKLLEMGIPAVCSIGGAGKWRYYGYPNYLQDLKGARVVLCPDRDLPGIQHCEDINKDFPQAEWLYSFPDSPEWLKLPKRGGLDIADWISQGANKQHILDAIGAKKYRAIYRYHHWQPKLVIASLRRITA